MQSSIRFDGQVAIVTGAGGGIGRGIALELARRGARVVVNDYGGDTYGRAGTATTAEAVAAEIRAAGGEAVANTTAVGTPAAAREIAACALDTWGRIDALANNAGVSLPGAITEFTDAEIENHFRINLLGAYALVRAVWPAMLRNRYGRILNTASSAALGIGANAPYATTKAGLIGLALDAAMEGRPHGILVNAMLPTAYSRMIEQIPSPAYVAWFRTHMPAAKVGASAAYLLSSTSSVTGRIVALGGGCAWRIAFAASRGHIDPDSTAESLHAHWPQVDAMDACRIVDSNDAVMQLYAEAFPDQGGVPGLDPDAVVGAGPSGRRPG